MHGQLEMTQTAFLQTPNSIYQKKTDTPQS